MDAEDWLKSIEKKLDIAQCSDREKVLFAGQPQTGGRPTTTPTQTLRLSIGMSSRLVSELTMYPTTLSSLRRRNFLTWTNGVWW
jgi:hypothetical protein